MNQDDIIRGAREANEDAPRDDFNSTAWVFCDEALNRFAELVAAAEREACAKAVEDMVHGNVKTCAAAIRARGNA